MSFCKNSHATIVSASVVVRRGVEQWEKIEIAVVGNAKNDGSFVLNLTRRTKKMRDKFLYMAHV